MLNLSNEEYKEFARERYRTDLRAICLDILGLKSLWDEGHDNLIDFIDDNSEFKKFLFLAPRETFKSTIITIGRCIQEILKDHDTTILLASDITTNAESFLSVIKKILETNKELISLFGKFESDKWNESEITIRQRKIVSKTPTISCAGSDKVTTSQHYRIIFCDDMVNRKTVNTLEQLQNTEKFFSDVADLLEKQIGKLYVVGTRWDEGDYYGKIIDKRSNDYAIFNKMATKDGTIDGELCYPKKLSREVLKQLLRDKGSRDFYLQYMNTVTSSDTQIFTGESRHWKELPEVLCHLVLCDPAISKKTGSDDAIVLDLALTEDMRIFLVEYKIFNEEDKHPNNLISIMFDFQARHGSEIFGIESVGYQEALCILTEDEIKKRGLSDVVRVIPIKNNDDKASRIICLQSFWERGDLLLKQGMIEAQEQFRKFRKPIISKVDLIDCISFSLKIDRGELNFAETVNRTSRSEKDNWIPNRYRNAREAVLNVK